MFSFAAPLALFGLLGLPLIYWLLRVTPPRPREIVFPPTRILRELKRDEETPAKNSLVADGVAAGAVRSLDFRDGGPGLGAERRRRVLRADADRDR